MADKKVYVQVRFSEDTEFGEYQDALYYPMEDYSLVDQKQIDLEIQGRVVIFVEFVKNIPPVLEQTKEEILAQIDELSKLKVELREIFLQDFDPTKEELEKIVDELDLEKETIQNKLEEIDPKNVISESIVNEISEGK